MRKIQFRGKAIKDYDEINIKENDWVYGSYMYSYAKKHLIYFIGDPCHWIEIKRETLGQFICTIDPDDKEIDLYEGDIIQVDEEFMLGNIKVNGVIDYDESLDCYMVLFPNYGISKTLYLYTENGIKLLGNDIDNPELLEIEAEIIK